MTVLKPRRAVEFEKVYFSSLSVSCLLASLFGGHCDFVHGAVFGIVIGVGTANAGSLISPIQSCFWTEQNALRSSWSPRHPHQRG